MHKEEVCCLRQHVLLVNNLKNIICLRACVLTRVQRRFIVFVNSGQTKWRGRLKFCMRLRNRYKYHVLAAHTSSQKSTVFFLTFSLDFQKFFRKSSKTHRKRQNIQCLTEDPSVYFLIVYKEALQGFPRNPLRKRFFGYRKWKKKLNFRIFFRKSSKTHRKQLNLHWLTKDSTVLFYCLQKSTPGFSSKSS